MTAAYSNLRGRYRSLGRSFRIPHITHCSAAYFRRIHSANYFPHSAFPQITNTRDNTVNTEKPIGFGMQAGNQIVLMLQFSALNS